EIIDPPILGRRPGPGVETVHEEGWTGNAGPEPGNRVASHVVGGPKPNILVEFPAIGTVLVLVDAVLGQMPGLFGGKMGVGLVHPLMRFLQRRVTARHASGVSALLIDPGTHAFSDRLAIGFGVGFRAGTETFDRDEAGDVLRIDAGVAQSDVAAEGVADDTERGEVPLMNQLREVVDVVGGRVMT